MSFYRKLLRYLLPSGECVLCLDPAHQHGLCTSCNQQLPRIASEQRTRLLSLPASSNALSMQVYSLFLYQWPVHNMQHQFKYNKDYDLGSALAGVFTKDYLHDHGQQQQWQLIPTPMYWKRRWRRGLHHTAFQASYLASSLQASLAPTLLTRRRDTPPQVGLRKAQRQKNMRHAFTVRRTVKNKNILLFDDIVTTGSTMQEMATTLYRAGAKEVKGLSITRAD